MIRRIYAIWDRTAGDVAMTGALMLHGHDAIAIRDFTDAVLTPQSRLAMHPEDYALLCMGYIETAPEGPIVHAAEQPITVITAEQVVAATKGA